jgi:hypothetical protein
MESNGFPMCIHISKPTMELLSPYEEWLEFGSKEIKGCFILQKSLLNHQYHDALPDVNPIVFLCLHFFARTKCSDYLKMCRERNYDDVPCEAGRLGGCIRLPAGCPNALITPDSFTMASFSTNLIYAKTDLTIEKKKNCSNLSQHSASDLD